jgi:hypothetical protein
MPREYLIYMDVFADFAVTPTLANWNTLRDDIIVNRQGWRFLHNELARYGIAMNIAPGHKPKFSQGIGHVNKHVMVKIDIPLAMGQDIRDFLGTSGVQETIDAMVAQLEGELQDSAEEALGLSPAQAAKITIPAHVGDRINTFEDKATIQKTVTTYLQNRAAIWYAPEA